MFRSFGSSGLIRKGMNPNSIGRLVQDMVRKAQISLSAVIRRALTSNRKFDSRLHRVGGSFAKQEIEANNGSS